MNEVAREAYENAERLYDQYVRLAELSDLAALSGSEVVSRDVVVSVSSTICETFGNAVLG